MKLRKRPVKSGLCLTNVTLSKNAKVTKKTKKKNTTEKNKICRFCGKDFKKPYDCLRHEQTHSELHPVKLYFCDRCNYGVNEKYKLKNHRKSKRCQGKIHLKFIILKFKLRSCNRSSTDRRNQRSSYQSISDGSPSRPFKVFLNN